MRRGALGKGVLGKWVSIALISAWSLAAHASSEAREEAPLGWPPVLELDHVLLQTSLYTRHFSPDPDHNNDQELISIELHTPDRWLAGGARFINSHHQESFFLYAGREFPLWRPHHAFEVRAKLTAGLLHGYRGEHRDDVPFNRYGTSPAALPSVGARWGPVEADLIIFGAGMMFTGGIRF